MTQTRPDSDIRTAMAPRRAGKVLVRRAIVATLGLLCLGSVPVLQGSNGPGIQSVNAAEQPMPVLFVSGSTGTVGMDADHNDELVFKDGHLHSRECSKLGFRKGATRVEREGNLIRFSAVNVSPEYGTLTWKGVIRDGVVQALYVWKKERLFWTIQRQYWFNGKVSNVVD